MPDLPSWLCGFDSRRPLRLFLLGRRRSVRRLWTFGAALFLFCALACLSWRSLTVCPVARWVDPTRVSSRRWRRHHPRAKLEPGRPAPAVRPEPRHCARPYGPCSVSRPGRTGLTPVTSMRCHRPTQLLLFLYLGGIGRGARREDAAAVL
jgi:hypothetical protein